MISTETEPEQPPKTTAKKPATPEELAAIRAKIRKSLGYIDEGNEGETPEPEHYKDPQGLNRRQRRDLSNKLANSGDDSAANTATKAAGMAYLQKTDPQAAYRISAERLRKQDIEAMRQKSGIEKTKQPDEVDEGFLGDFIGGYLDSKIQQKNIERGIRNAREPEEKGVFRHLLPGNNPVQPKAPVLTKKPKLPDDPLYLKMKDDEPEHHHVPPVLKVNDRAAEYLKHYKKPEPGLHEEDLDEESSTGAVAPVTTPKAFRSSKDKMKNKRDDKKRAFQRRGDEPFGRDILPTPEQDKLKEQSFRTRFQTDESTKEEPIWKLNEKGVPFRSLLDGPKAWMIAENNEVKKTKVEDTFKEKLKRLNDIFNRK